MTDQVAQVQTELVKFGDDCGTDLEGASMPGPKGYTHGWVHHPFNPNPGLSSIQLNSLNNNGSQTDANEIYRAYVAGEPFVGDGYTGKEREAIHSYIDSPVVNVYLRRNYSLESPWGQQYKHELALLDSASSRTKLKNDTLLFRSVRRHDLSHYGSFQIGDTITDPGYISTSLDPIVTSEFGEIMLVIETPAGTPMIWNQGIHSIFMDQSEVILPRDSKIRVTRIEPDRVYGSLISNKE